MDNFLVNCIPCTFARTDSSLFCFISHSLIVPIQYRLIYDALTSPMKGLRAYRKTPYGNDIARALGVRFVLRLRESRVIAGVQLGRRPSTSLLRSASTVP